VADPKDTRARFEEALSRQIKNRPPRYHRPRPPEDIEAWVRRYLQVPPGEELPEEGRKLVDEGRRLIEASRPMKTLVGKTCQCANHTLFAADTIKLA
jgi:hypothetical protein